MSDRVTSLALTCFLLLVVTAATWMAFDFGDEARRVPLAVGIPTAAFLTTQLVRELLAFRLGAKVSDAKEAEETEGSVAQATGQPGATGPARRPESSVSLQAAEVDEPAPKASARQAFAWILLLGSSFYLLGMLATVPVFMVAFMRVYGRESWKLIAAFVFATLVILHLFFVVLLEVQLYPGVVGDWLDL